MIFLLICDSPARGGKGRETPHRARPLGEEASARVTILLSHTPRVIITSPRPRPVAGAKLARRAAGSGGERNERRSGTRFDAHRRHDDNPTRGHPGGARERDGVAARRLRSWPVA